MTQQYEEDQINSGLKVGDRVKVLRKASDDENGWDNIWMSEMSKSIKQIGTIVDIYKTGVTIIFDDSWLSTSYSYPYFVLQKETVSNMTRGYSSFCFKVGDKVKIKSKETRNGSYIWTPAMEHLIGSIGQTEKTNSTSNSVLLITDDGRYWFPIEALVLINDINDDNYIVDADMEKPGGHPWFTKPGNVGKESIPHYPHVCPKCGSASYNNLFINNVDCSKLGCDGKR